MISPGAAGGAALLVTCAISAMAVQVQAQEMSNWRGFDLTSTTLAAWHTDGANYGELFERLNLTTGYDAFQLGLRGDAAKFVQPPSSAVRDRYTLEKAWLSWTTRSLDLVAGDAYISFGRGLSLSLRKVDELGLDTTLRGAKLLMHADGLGGTLAAGYTNINNVDEATGRSIDDPLDIIAAARVEGTARGATIGVHGTAIAFHDALGLVRGDSYRDRFYHLGFTIDAPTLSDWLGLYLEGVAQLHRAGGGPDAAPAYGLYGTATAYVGEVTLVAEGKAYGDLEPVKPRVARPEFAAVAYNNPPTAERLLQILENPQRDIRGGRLRADWKVTPSVTSYGNYAVFYDRQGYADPNAIGAIRSGVIHDAYVGTEVRTSDARAWLLTTIGIRSVFLNGSGTLVRRDTHLEIDGARSLGGEWSATLHVVHEERIKYESRILDRHFREGTLLVGLRCNPWGSVAGGYDFTTDPTQPRRDYFNGSAEWTITPSSSLRGLVGGTRGGLRCVSGVCRAFPAFEGVKLSATLRF
jgi:hypothetical protein